MPRVGVLAWNDDEQPDVNTLRRILGELSGLRVDEVGAGAGRHLVLISEGMQLDDAELAGVVTEYERTGETIVRLDAFGAVMPFVPTHDVMDGGEFNQP